MGHRYRPPYIEEAVMRGDTAFLAMCGRKGARRKREIAEAKKAAEWKSILRLCKAEAEDLTHSRNEHIISADGVDLGYHNRPYEGARWEDQGELAL